LLERKEEKRGKLKEMNLILNMSHGQKGRRAKREDERKKGERGRKERKGNEGFPEFNASCESAYVEKKPGKKEKE